MKFEFGTVNEAIAHFYNRAKECTSQAADFNCLPRNREMLIREAATWKSVAMTLENSDLANK